MYPNNYQFGPPRANEPITVHSTQLSSTRRGPWSPEEDRKLIDLISIFGPSNWVRISNSLCTRTPKQCRERYHQNLKPTLNRTPITQEEGILIEKLVAKHGKKWAEIARHLNGRSDNAIKNWWNGGANRRRRASQTVAVKTDDDKALVSPPAAVPGPQPPTNSSNTNTLPPNLTHHPTTTNSTIPTNSSNLTHHPNSTHHPGVAAASAFPVLPVPGSLGVVFNTSMFSDDVKAANQASGPGLLPPIAFNPSTHPHPTAIPGIGSMAPHGHPHAPTHLHSIPPINKAPVHAAHAPLHGVGSVPPGLRLSSLSEDHGPPPLLGPTKRRLLDEHAQYRRHSSANTLSHFVSSHSGLTSPYTQSRNNSLLFEPSSGANSSLPSRRSSIAPENSYLNHKRNTSQHSFSPSVTPLTRFLISLASGLNASPNASNLTLFHSNSSTSIYSNSHSVRLGLLSTQGTVVSRHLSEETVGERKDDKKRMAVSNLID